MLKSAHMGIMSIPYKAKRRPQVQPRDSSVTKHAKWLGDAAKAGL
jgi:hypothetical protein